MKGAFICSGLISAALAISAASPLTVLSQNPAPSFSAAGEDAKRATEAATRGERLRRRWDLGSAEAAFREAASLDPANLEAALGLARVARAKFDYSEALSLLDKAARYHRNSPDLLAEYGALYLAAEEPARARKYFDDALKLDPSCLAARIGRAGADLLDRDYGSAEARLRECIAQYPKSSVALVLLARVLLERNQNKEAETRVGQALSLDPYDTDAIYLLAFLKAAERRPGEVRALAERGLALDPLSPGLRRMLSSYLDGQAGYNQRVSEMARKHYERGLALKQKGTLAEAVKEFEAALRIEPRYYRTLIALGDVWLREGDHERAAAAAKLALEVDPQGAAAHLELSYANLGMHEEARLRIGATDFAAAFYNTPAAPVFDLTAQVFPDYKSLGRRQQMVIDRAVAPLAQFLPKLVARGAKHYLLPFDQRLGDFAEVGGLDDRKTFDGRYYSSLRGAGGRITLSGFEYVDMAARGGVDIIAHEFAHQVHMTALGQDDVKLIRKLYERALREDRALDFYAAADEYEYFAQGYEAFISPRKRPAASVTARHTKKELFDRDPQLYQFFVKLAEGSVVVARKASLGSSALR